MLKSIPQRIFVSERAAGFHLIVDSHGLFFLENLWRLLRLEFWFCKERFCE